MDCCLDLLKGEFIQSKAFVDCRSDHLLEGSINALILYIVMHSYAEKRFSHCDPPKKSV